MEASSKFVVRFFAVSALLHVAVGSIVVAMVRVGSTGHEEASAAVEVSLVESDRDVNAATVPLASAVTPEKTDIVPPAPITNHPAPAPMGAPISESDPIDDAAGIATSATAASVEPRYDDSFGTHGVTTALGSTTGSGAIAEEASPGGAEQGDAVRAWLERHKRYPRAAMQRGVEGEATLELLLDAAGSVRSAAVVQSSGHGVLDDEVTRMVARAVPFPPATRPSAGVARYRIVIEFHLEEE
jgi:periplasmic protein TonB